LGSFTGALVAALIAASHKMKFALGLGAFTMLGGIAAAFLIPAPTWFIASDLILAYIPTAYFAGMIADRKS
jgi:predicted ABC-type sugar transport system permease subunit